MLKRAKLLMTTQLGCSSCEGTALGRLAALCLLRLLRLGVARLRGEKRVSVCICIYEVTSKLYSRLAQRRPARQCERQSSKPAAPGWC